MRGALQDCSEQRLVNEATLHTLCAECHLNGLEVDSLKTAHLVTKSTKLEVLFILKIGHCNKQWTMLEIYLCFIETFEKGALIYLAVLLHTTDSTVVVLLNV